MRAVGLFTHGGPEVLQVVDLPEVHAGPGEVRVRVHAATVNPTDVAVRNGMRAEQQKEDQPPYVPGRWCQSNRNSAPIDAAIPASATVQAMRLCHSATAAERRVL